MKKQLIELSQKQQKDTYQLQPPYSLETYLNTKIPEANGSPQLQSYSKNNYLNSDYQPYDDFDESKDTNCFQDCWRGFVKRLKIIIFCDCFRNHVGLDHLKLKIVATVIVSICCGIIFTGIVNFALALVLADNITKTTTAEIANVQIDYTRTIGLHLGCVYQHMIQEQLDKALTVLARVQEVFSGTFTPTGIATFIFHSRVSNAYLSYLSGSTAGTCLTSEAKNQDQIMWFTTTGNQVTTTTYISTLMDTFSVLRSIVQDTELQGIAITIFDGSQVSFPQRYDSSYGILTSTTQTMLTSSDYVNTQNMYVNNQKRFFYSMKHANAVCSGTTTVMISITLCLAVLCSDIGNPAPCGLPSAFGGTICLYFLIKESNFLHSLKNRDISKIYISQLNAAQTNQAHDPLIAFDSITTNFISSFWSEEFNVASYTGSEDALNFYNKFDKYYTIYSSTEFLITSTYMKADREFQIAIYTVNFDTDASFSGTQLIFTTITEIPISDEIFKAMNEQISSSMKTLLIAGIFLLIGILLAVSWYIYRYSKHIIIPINKLKEQVEQIDHGNLYIKVQNDTQRRWQEIDSLFEHFEHLNTIIRASDDFYYQDLSEETLIKYSQAYNLFEQQGNRKGMGIVQNNIGNIHMKQERIENAMQSYLESFQIAERDLLELLLVDNIFAFYNVQPFNGWESAKRYDFSYNYLFYEKIKNRPQTILLGISNKPQIEKVLSNRAYSLGTAYLQASFRTTHSAIKQDYLTNAIDYLHLTEKLDFNHSKCSSRTIFTKLKLVQAYLEKAKYYYDMKVEDKYIQLYIESLRSQDSAVDQMTRFEMMYKLFEQNFQNEIPPEILRQHCKYQEGCCYVEFNKFGKAIKLFTDNLREGIRYDPQIRKQCLNKIKWILEQQKLVDIAPDLLKMIKKTEMKKQKDIVFVLDFSQSMNCITKESYQVHVKIRQREISNASQIGLPRNSLKYGTNRIRENSKTNDSYLQIENVRTNAQSNYNINSVNWSNQNNNNSNKIAKRTSQQISNNPNGVVQDRKSLLNPKKVIEYNHKNAAISQFLRLFNDFVENEDRVAFVRFNENIDVVFELNEKNNNTNFLRSSIQNSYDLEPKGESAVRQAIYQAMKLFQKTVPMNHSQWIVLFSDGGDSCSTITDRQLLKCLNQAEVNLFIIGCGLDEYASKQFRQLCEKTKNGIFIETNSNQSEIDIAFQAITNKIYGNADINYNVEEFL